MIRAIVHDIRTFIHDYTHDWLVNRLIDDPAIILLREIDCHVTLYSHIKVGIFWFVYRLEYKNGYSEWFYLEKYPFFKISATRIGITTSKEKCNIYVVTDLLSD